MDSEPKDESTCPHCGYCRHCGRSDAVKVAPAYPLAPWYTPYPVSPWWGVVPPPYGYIPTITVPHITMPATGGVSTTGSAVSTVTTTNNGSASWSWT